MAVTISGMFGDGKVYFCGSPVIITVEGLSWPTKDGLRSSPFNTVYVDVTSGGSKVGEFRRDTDGATSATFDISPALRAIWSDYAYGGELKAAARAAGAPGRDSQAVINAGYQPDQDACHSTLGTLIYRSYSLKVRTEYVDPSSGEFTETTVLSRDGGMCFLGAMTEWERFVVGSDQKGLVYFNGKNRRNGDASTKPSEMPERVGRYSMTSWTDLTEMGARSVFYPYSAATGDDGTGKHAPKVLRDTQDYADFLFVNRRGAVETCSALMKEAMEVAQEKKRYSRMEGPVFRPSATVAVTATQPRRSWQMSSGLVTREWAEWWITEFLASKRHWMRYPIGAEKAAYLPVVVEPARKSSSAYDRARQQMAHVEFTVTLVNEG